MNRRFDITDPNTAVAAIVVLCMVYIGSQRWAKSAWAEAAGTGGTAAIGIIAGKWKGKREGFEEGEEDGFNRGYWTPNPGITTEQRIGITQSVASAVLDRGVDYALDKLPRWPTSEPAAPSAPPALQLQQQASDPRDAKPVGPRLPQGWRIDGKGRFRDENKRIASDDRRREALRKEGRQ
jgi:hypothetical protein